MPAGFLSRSEGAQPGAWDTVNTQRWLNPLLWGLLGKLSHTHKGRPDFGVIHDQQPLPRNLVPQLSSGQSPWASLACFMQV